MPGSLTFSKPLAMKHAPEICSTGVQEAVGDDPCTLYVRGLEADVDRDTLATMFQVGRTCAPVHCNHQWSVRVWRKLVCLQGNLQMKVVQVEKAC